MPKEQKQDTKDCRASEIVPQEVVGDEVDLIDSFLVLMKHKWFIALGAIVPTLIIGLVFFLQPRGYKVSYSYRMALGETDIKVLEEKFYSTENTGRLIEDFQSCGLEEHAQKLAAAQAEDVLKQFVTFEVSPPLFDTTAKTFDELLKRQEAKGTLLVMHVEEKEEETFPKAASVYRENFEKTIPLYLEKNALISRIAGYKRDMADIEESRYTLNQQLERKKNTLDKLKKSSTEGSEKLPSGIVLQFDNASGNSAYLPLSYQIQAVQTQIITLEEDVRSRKEQYDYDADLLKCDETLLDGLDSMVRSRSTLQQFHTFLTDTLATSNQDAPHLQDHLRGYIKRIENDITTAIPLIEKPMVYAATKGTLKKTALVFVIALMLSILGAFLREGLKQKKLSGRRY